MKTQIDKLERGGSGEYLGDPGSILIVVYIGIIIFFLLLGSLSSAWAGEKREIAAVAMGDVKQGELLIQKDGDTGFHPAPMLSQDVEISISGMIVNARVVQQFQNTTAKWQEALYVFPLPDESAVKALRMVVGDRVILGEIKEKEEARQIYEQARSEGKKTSLLAQNRPNIFTMAVANIPPHSMIRVEIEYLDQIHYEDGIFSLRFPMVVGPRYIPGTPLKTETGLIRLEGGWAVDTDQVPDASKITPAVAGPEEPLLHPVQLSLSLVPGFAIEGLTSLYHGVAVEKKEGDSYQMRFNGKVFANRDFVIEYRPAAGREISAALFREEAGGDNYMYLMLMPPAEKGEKKLPREVIFVLDISGSMAGTSILQAKRAMQYAIARLMPHDRFNVIVFNSTAGRFYPTAVAADQGNKDLAIRKIAAIEADGGTEISSALQLALDGRSDHQRIRQVVFLTDGAVGNETDLFSTITQALGDSRLFTIGIGSAPNSYFMTRAAAMGRGCYSYIGDVDEVEKSMNDLFEKLENPVITGLKLFSADGEPLEIYPDPLPDLYMGQPVVALIRSSAPVAGLRLTGMAGAEGLSLGIDANTDARPGIATLWGRTKIRSLMDSLNLGADEAAVRKEVVAAALTHHLVSRYTSLVAVEQQVSRPSADGLDTAQLKTNLPQGWQYDKVFGAASRTATPSTLYLAVGLALLVLAGIMLQRDKRRGI